MFVVQHHCHTLEAVERDGALRVIHLVVDDGTEALVLGEPQLQLLAVAAMREDRHGHVFVLGFDHHLNGHALVGKVAVGLTLCVSLVLE